MGDWADEKAERLVPLHDQHCDADRVTMYDHGPKPCVCLFRQRREAMAKALRSVRAEALREAVGVCREYAGKAGPWKDQHLEARGAWDALRDCADAIEALIAADGGG